MKFTRLTFHIHIVHVSAFGKLWKLEADCGMQQKKVLSHTGIFFFALDGPFSKSNNIKAPKLVLAAVNRMTIKIPPYRFPVWSHGVWH